MKVINVPATQTNTKHTSSMLYHSTCVRFRFRFRLHFPFIEFIIVITMRTTRALTPVPRINTFMCVCVRARAQSLVHNIMLYIMFLLYFCILRGFFLLVCRFVYLFSIPFRRDESISFVFISIDRIFPGSLNRMTSFCKMLLFAISSSYRQCTINNIFLPTSTTDEDMIAPKHKT